MPKKNTSRRKTQNLVISIILFISIVLIGYFIKQAKKIFIFFYGIYFPLNDL